MRYFLILGILVFVFSPVEAKKKKPAPKPATIFKPVPEPAAAPVPAPAPEAPPAAPAPVAAPEAPPAPEPPPPPPPPPAKVEKANVDLQALEAEYHALRDELFRARAKAELVGQALFKTRLVVNFQYQAQRAWPLKKVTLLLDDQPLKAAEAPAAEEPIRLWEGFASPGRHVIALRAEASGVGDPSALYVAAAEFAFEIPDGKQQEVLFTVDESGDGPQSLAKKKQGSVDLRVKADIKTREFSK